MLFCLLLVVLPSPPSSSSLSYINVVVSVVIVTVLILTSWGDHALHSDLNFRYRPSHQFPERIRRHLGTRHDTTDRSREGTGNEEMT